MPYDRELVEIHLFSTVNHFLDRSFILGDGYRYNLVLCLTRILLRSLEGRDSDSLSTTTATG